MFLVGILASGFAYGQAATARAMMGSAMQELIGNENLRFALTGTEKYGNQQTSLSEGIYLRNWFDGTRRQIQLDMQIGRNNILDERITGDGTSLWMWKPAKKEYGCINYGNFEGGQPDRYARNLCQLIDVEARGHAALPARLIHQAFGNTDAGVSLPQDRLWAPWPAMADITIDGIDVVCTVGNPATMEVRYELQQLGQNKFKLVGIDYYELAAMGAKQRETNWHLDIVRLNQVIPPEAFKFIPPAGAKAVSLPARTGG